MTEATDNTGSVAATKAELEALKAEVNAIRTQDSAAAEQLDALKTRLGNEVKARKNERLTLLLSFLLGIIVLIAVLLLVQPANTPPLAPITTIPSALNSLLRSEQRAREAIVIADRAIGTINTLMASVQVGAIFLGFAATAVIAAGFRSNQQIDTKLAEINTKLAELNSTQARVELLREDNSTFKETIETSIEKFRGEIKGIGPQIREESEKIEAELKDKDAKFQESIAASIKKFEEQIEKIGPQIREESKTIEAELKENNTEFEKTIKASIDKFTRKLSRFQQDNLLFKDSVSKSVDRLEPALATFKAFESAVDDRLEQTRQALDLLPNKSEAVSYVQFGQQKAALGDLLSAVDAYKKADELAPEHVVTKYFLGDMYLRLEQYYRAYEVLSVATQDGKDFSFPEASAAYAYALRYIAKTQSEPAASETIEKAKSIYSRLWGDPNNHFKTDTYGESIFGAMGGLLRRTDKNEEEEEALVWYRRAAEATPNSSYPLNNIALLRLKSVSDQHIAEAKNIFQAIIDINKRRAAYFTYQDFWTYFDFITAKIALIPANASDAEKNDILAHLKAVIEILYPPDPLGFRTKKKQLVEPLEKFKNGLEEIADFVENKDFIIEVIDRVNEEIAKRSPQ